MPAGWNEFYEDIEPGRMLLEVLSARPAVADDPEVSPLSVPERVGIDLWTYDFLTHRVAAFCADATCRSKKEQFSAS